MLKKISGSVIKSGYCFLLFISLIWLLVSIGYSTTLIDTLNKYGYILAFLAIIILLSQNLQQLTKKIVLLLYKYWYWTFVVLLCYQLLIILTNSALVYGDIKAVIENIKGVGNHNYFSAFPNNYVYGLYVKVLYNLVGLKYLVLVQELINIVILNGSIIAFSKVIDKNTEKEIGATYFVISIGIIGLNPQFLSTYTDYWSYFTATVVCILLLKIFSGNIKVHDYIALGFFIGLGYLIRPTIFIYVIALAFVLFFRTVVNSERKLLVNGIKGIVSIVIGLLVFTCAVTAVQKTDILYFRSGYDKNLAYFFDLGLTSTGAAHIELPVKALDQNSPDNIVEPLIAKDTQNRLKKYTFKQTVTKFKIAFQEGNLGWRIEHPLGFLDFQKNKVTSRFIESKLGEKIRTYIFFLGVNFNNLDFFLQIMWILMIFGIVSQLLKIIKNKDSSSINLFLSLSVLGAFMYLMIFEAGRSRYLISFLPVLILLSAMGYQSKEEKNYEAKN